MFNRNQKKSHMLILNNYKELSLIKKNAQLIGSKLKEKDLKLYILIYKKNITYNRTTKIQGGKCLY